jgi:CheY-like chemotaxis protein
LKLLETGTKLDLVFSDIVMPGTIDGVGHAKEIRSRYPNLPWPLRPVMPMRQEATHQSHRIAGIARPCRRDLIDPCRASVALGLTDPPQTWKA